MTWFGCSCSFLLASPEVGGAVNDDEQLFLTHLLLWRVRRRKKPCGSRGDTAGKRYLIQNFYVYFDTHASVINGGPAPTQARLANQSRARLSLMALPSLSSSNRQKKMRREIINGRSHVFFLPLLTVPHSSATSHRGSDYVKCHFTEVSRRPPLVAQSFTGRFLEFSGKVGQSWTPSWKIRRAIKERHHVAVQRRRRPCARRTLFSN